MTGTLRRFTAETVGAPFPLAASAAPASGTMSMPKPSISRPSHYSGIKAVYIGPFKITHELHLPGASKNDEPIDLPILPSLEAAIDALPADNLTFVLGRDGKPLTKESFGNWFHDCCLEAGLLPKVGDVSGRAKGLSAHGLRKRMGALLAEAGCSEFEIAAVLGHRDLRQARTYTTGARRKHMAWKAVLTRLGGEQPGTSSSHTPGPVSHTAPEVFGNKAK